MKIRIWIDADSCPVLVRDHTLKYAKNRNIPVIFVANKEIKSETGIEFEMIITGSEKDAADNYICEHAEKSDLVITRDFLFAEKLVEKEITCINDRGTKFTKDNIRELVSERDFNLSLAQMGLTNHKSSGYSQKHFKLFCNCFDKEMQELIWLYRP